jgi:hypothetical protein
MLTASQFKINSNINRTTGRAPFDLILRFRPEIRINIETAETEDSYNALRCHDTYLSGDRSLG